ncbi:hypothetical protein ACFE04_021884 [Oxalis oulophora]
MKHHPDLKMFYFDRIILNFPHAGFFSPETWIMRHKSIVDGFFNNARSMLLPNGTEIHVTHKIGYPSQWNLDELAILNSLNLIECIEFEVVDYPGYQHKKGSGPNCNTQTSIHNEMDKTCSMSQNLIMKKRKADADEILLMSEYNKKRVGGYKLVELKQDEEKWLTYYSSKHKILLVGEGDFSFSLCLARAFGSASNIYATSLDSHDELVIKYKNAKCNLEELQNLGASLLHGVNASSMKFHPHLRMVKFDRDFSFSLCLAEAFGSASNITATSLDSYVEVVVKYSHAGSNLVNLQELGASLLHKVDATKMKHHPDLKMFYFDRIIFNFPHAGFLCPESWPDQIMRHQSIVNGFFNNARSMLLPNGEIHVTHKTEYPYSKWNLEELAIRNSLRLIECIEFEMVDYPGYRRKKGSGPNCNKPFKLGECSTFKFKI